MLDDEYSDPWNNQDPEDPYAPPPPPPQEQLGSYFVPINSNAPNGQQDLSYWQSRHDEGLPGAPGVGDMFDLTTGQLKPGWKRTAKGYEFVGNTAAPPPPGPNDPYGYTPPGPRTTGGSLNLGRPPGFLPYPDYQSPGDFVPSEGPFTFDAYTPSSWADAQNEPGFEQAQQRLSKMVQNSAAYQGVLRSGATIGKLDSVLDTNQGQNFAQFDARRFRNWDANRDNAFQTWSSQYGMDKDKYTFHAQDVDRGNNYRFNVADRSFADELARWQEQVRSLTTLGQPRE